jgi:Spindle and kinetochore-associated protein 1
LFFGSLLSIQETTASTSHQLLSLKKPKRISISFHQQKGNTMEQRAEDLLDLFSTTVSSLAMDASTLKVLSSLRISAALGEAATEDSELVLDGLRDLHLAVADIESKVRILQDIAAEEKRSLVDLEAVKTAAEAQSAVLDHMMESYQAMSLEHQEKENQKRTSTIRAALERKRFETTTHPKARRVIRRDPTDATVLSPAQQPLSSQSKLLQTPVRVRSITVQQVNLDLITQEEYLSVSKNIRGRITLAVVNDALLDIERVCRKKYNQLSRHMTPGKELPKVHKEHADMAVAEHGDCPWVSEQDLRQSCAFFRSGESTARAILAILRSLRRIKQVPGRNAEVTYVCCL